MVIAAILLIDAFQDVVFISTRVEDWLIHCGYGIATLVKKEPFYPQGISLLERNMHPEY